jgi:hypothetical protein
LRRPTVQFKEKYVRELTIALVIAIRNILTADGYEKCSDREVRSIDNVVDLMVPLDSEQAVDASKYLTSYQLPRLVGDEEPKRPDFLSETSTLFVGEWGRYVGRLNSNHGRITRRQKSIALSILMIKRGLPPLPKSFKESVLTKLKANLLLPGKTPEVLLLQIERTANELFPIGWDSQLGPIPHYSASPKSCFENSYSQGGTQDHIFSPSVPIGTNRKEQIIDFSCPMLREVPSHPNSRDCDAFEDACRRTVPDTMKCKVELVPDVFKLRAVTKNNWQCGMLKPLQKMMHKQLKKNPVFRLIGETLTEDIINDIDLFPGASYVSGDYKSATDLLHSDATEAAIGIVIGNMTGPMAQDTERLLLALRSLTGLTVCSDKFITEFIMVNGQLMGSLLSFIFLCLINFAIWRHCAEQVNSVRCNGNGLGGRFDHVLVNGDDIGFAATVKMFKAWKLMTPLVGFLPSAGKNYFTSEFIMLNSLMFCWNFELKKLTSLRFVNQKLLRVPGGECVLENQDALGKMHDDFVMGARNKGAASGIFICSHKKLLKMSWRNLFGPHELGGLGATPVPGSKSESYEGYSVRQLIIAKLLYDADAHMYTNAKVSRYDAFQKKYLERVFPNVLVAREADLPLLEIDYDWKNVTDLVGEASISFQSMCSWLAPYHFSPRNLWRKMNGLYSSSNGILAGDMRHKETKILDVSRYLECRGDLLIWQETRDLFWGEDEDEMNCVHADVWVAPRAT